MPKGQHDHLFQKGKSGNPKGRPAGIKDKVTFNVGQICKEAGFNPFIKLIELAKNGQTERIQLEASGEIAAYVAPKLKAVEISSADAKETFSMIMSFGKPKEGEETAKDEFNNVPSEQNSE